MPPHLSAAPRDCRQSLRWKRCALSAQTLSRSLLKQCCVSNLSPLFCALGKLLWTRVSTFRLSSCCAWMLRRTLLYKVSSRTAPKASVSSCSRGPVLLSFPCHLCHTMYHISATSLLRLLSICASYSTTIFCNLLGGLGLIIQSVSSLSGVNTRMAARLYVPISADNGTTFENKTARLHLKTIAEPG